jgi:hypothetical protein
VLPERPAPPACAAQAGIADEDAQRLDVEPGERLALQDARRDQRQHAWQHRPADAKVPDVEVDRPAGRRRGLHRQAPVGITLDGVTHRPRIREDHGVPAESGRDDARPGILRAPEFLHAAHPSGTLAEGKLCISFRSGVTRVAS